MPNCWGSWSAVSALLLLGTAHAQPAADPLQQRALAAVCAQCHGTAGRAVADSPLPSLAGMPAERLQAQMRAFKDGSRPATVMHQIAKGYTDAQIAQLAAYFAGERP